MTLIDKKLAEKVCNAISEQKLWPVDEIEVLDERNFKCVFKIDDGVSDVQDMIGSGMYDLLKRDVDDYEIWETDGHVEVVIRYIKGEHY